MNTLETFSIRIQIFIEAIKRQRAALPETVHDLKILSNDGASVQRTILDFWKNIAFNENK